MNIEIEPRQDGVLHVVNFYPGDLNAIIKLTKNGLYYIFIRMMCDNLGLSWRGEEARLRRAFGGDLLAREASRRATRRALGEQPLLRLSALPRWLDSVDSAVLEPWANVKLRAYRDAFYDRLWAELPKLDPTQREPGETEPFLSVDEAAVTAGVPPEVFWAISEKLGLIGDPRYGRWAEGTAPNGS